MQPTISDPGFINFDGVPDKAIHFTQDIFSVNWLSIIYLILVLLVIAFITVILYSLVRLYEYKQEDNKKDRAMSAVSNASRALDVSGVPTAESSVVKNNDIWNHIRERLLSDNQSDWRLAIIEADIYMDRLLDTKGYHGDTIADKLKQITPEALASVNIAWEAHKVRNRIAHQGSDFTLTMPESRRVLSYYEIVFRDLEVIE